MKKNKKDLRTFDNIGLVIKVRREQLKLSQAELAKSCGYLNGQFISNIERGLCNVPVEKVAIVSRQLELNPDKLIYAMSADFIKSVKAITKAKLQLAYDHSCEDSRLVGVA